MEVGWNNTASARNDIQRNLNCCGFRGFNPNDTCLAVSNSTKCFLEMYCMQMNHDSHAKMDFLMLNYIFKMLYMYLVFYIIMY